MATFDLTAKSTTGVGANSIATLPANAGTHTVRTIQEYLDIDALIAAGNTIANGDVFQMLEIPAGTLVLNNLAGFRVYVSSNLPSVGTGSGTSGTANQNSNYGAIVAGHGSAVATAEQLSKTETYRDPDSFADIVRGMHLYGRKILRPEAIVTAKYNAG